MYGDSKRHQYSCADQADPDRHVLVPELYNMISNLRRRPCADSYVPYHYQCYSGTQQEHRFCFSYLILISLCGIGILSFVLQMGFVLSTRLSRGRLSSLSFVSWRARRPSLSSSLPAAPARPISRVCPVSLLVLVLSRRRVGMGRAKAGVPQRSGMFLTVPAGYCLRVACGRTGGGSS